MFMSSLIGLLNRTFAFYQLKELVII